MNNIIDRNIIDYALNRITMYRLVLYYTGGLLAVAFALSLFQLVPPDPAALAFSAALITAVCWATNRLVCTSAAGAGQCGVGLYHGAHSRS